MAQNIKIICFDIDNVICRTNLKNDYNKSKPKIKIIRFINKLYDSGYIIKIYTARYMGRNNENYFKVNKLYYKTTDLILKRWGLRYHRLYMGKPNFDIFIDDKSLNFNYKWPKQLAKKLKFK
jgi:hypothetical protein